MEFLRQLFCRHKHLLARVSDYGDGDYSIEGRCRKCGHAISMSRRGSGVPWWANGPEWYTPQMSRSLADRTEYKSIGDWLSRESARSDRIADSIGRSEAT